jgi:hypothetical protein
MLGDQPSIEGFFVGRQNGHYHLQLAELLEAKDRTHEIGEVMVPAGRVAFYQMLADPS